MNKYLKDCLSKPMTQVSDVNKCFDYCMTAEEVSLVINHIPATFGSFKVIFDCDGAGFTIERRYCADSYTWFEEDSYLFFEPGKNTTFDYIGGLIATKEACPRFTGVLTHGNRLILYISEDTALAIKDLSVPNEDEATTVNIFADGKVLVMRNTFDDIHQRWEEKIIGDLTTNEVVIRRLNSMLKAQPFKGISSIHEARSVLRGGARIYAS